MRIAMLLLVVACGSAPGGGSCPNDQPVSCSTPELTYTANTKTLFQHFCTDCHSGPGEASSVPLTTHAAIKARKASVLAEISSCRMPRTGALSAADRMMFMNWLVCDAPE